MSAPAEPTFLSRFASAKTDETRARALVDVGYTHVRPVPNTNNVFPVRAGYDVRQLLRPTVRPNFFGRVHSLCAG
jgi:hypothetical protein